MPFEPHPLQDRLAFRQSCNDLGWSAREVAEALQMNDRTVRSWWDGDLDIPAPVAMLMEIWAHPDCPDWAFPFEGGGRFHE